MTKPPERLKGAGTAGGAASERGSTFRSGVAAWAIAYGLRGDDLGALGLSPGQAVPVVVSLETAFPVDDISIDLSGGGTAYVQAKRSLKMETRTRGEFSKVVSQWAEIVSQYRIDPGKDRLVLAVEEPSSGIRNLEAALRITQGAGVGLSQDKAAALRKLRDMLSGLDVDEIETVLKTVTIVQLHLSKDGERDAEHVRLLLDGSVVKMGQGLRAFRELRRKTWELAQWRQGGGMDEWLSFLRDAGLTIVKDTEKSAAARHELERVAEARYRQAVAAKGRQIDLRALGVTAGPIDVDPNIRAATPSERDMALDIMPAIRRRGRVLLTGLPGSGKTTAMHFVASLMAEDSNGSLPVYGHLGNLAGSRNSARPFQVLMDSIECPIGDADALRRAIERHAENGSLVVLLDGLDEARMHRLAMVRFVERLVKQFHEDTEVVLATRDSAYAQAATLGFRELRLLPPAHAYRLADAVVERMGETREDREQGYESWASTRKRWVRLVLDRDPLMRETPLLGVLLAILACRSHDGSLPHSRADVLNALISDTAKQWEFKSRLEGDLALGSLKAGESIEALLEIFDLLGDRALRTPGIEKAEVLPEIQRVLEGRWGLPTGRAGVAAEEALHFWDEAGVIVLSPDGTLRPRLLVLAEIGAARYLVSLSDDQLKARVKQDLKDETLLEMIALAAGLSRLVANAAVNHLVKAKSSDLHFLAARMIEEGVLANAAAKRRVRLRLLKHISNGSPLSWDAAKALSKLSVPKAEQAAVFAAFDTHLDHWSRVVARALAQIRWNGATPSAEKALLAVLSLGPRPKYTEGKRRQPGDGSLAR